MQITLVAWEKEALCKMPARLWQEMMEIHFPNTRWMKMGKDIYDRLVKYKAQTTFPTLQACLESLLDEALKDIHLTENTVHES